VKPPSPGFACRTALGGGEKVLERNVEEGGARLGEHLGSLPKFSVDMNAPAAALGYPRGDGEGSVDEDGPAVADEDPRCHGGEAVPGGEEAAGFVERSSDEAAVDDPGCGLVALAERERRLVALDPLLAGDRKMNALGVVPAPPTEGVVVRRDARYRNPPRSKCAL
jgi:hypothetical protein